MKLPAQLQARLTYFPDTDPAGPASRWFPKGSDIVLRTQDGLALSAWLVRPTGIDRDVAVLYCPGNGGNRAGRIPLTAALVERGLTVLALDYRGYGGNPGTPTQAGLAADARAAVAALAAVGATPARTLYLGESLGSGVAAELVTTHRPAGVLLRSPFTDLVDVAIRHVGSVARLLPDRYPVLDLLATVPVPVTVVYGSSDEIVPAELSRRVARGVAMLHEEVVVPGAGHNDSVMFGSVVADAVTRLADAVCELR